MELNNTLEINKTLPNWNLVSIASDNVPLIDNFKGKPLLILFLNLGCPGCKGRTLPYANRVIVENGDKVNVIHTRFEGPEYTKEDFCRAKEEYCIRFPFLVQTRITSYYD